MMSVNLQTSNLATDLLSVASNVGGSCHSSTPSLGVIDLGARGVCHIADELQDYIKEEDEEVSSDMRCVQQFEFSQQLEKSSSGHGKETGSQQPKGRSNKLMKDRTEKIQSKAVNNSISKRTVRGAVNNASTKNMAKGTEKQKQVQKGRDKASVRSHCKISDLFEKVSKEPKDDEICRALQIDLFQNSKNKPESAAEEVATIQKSNKLKDGTNSKNGSSTKKIEEGAKKMKKGQPAEKIDTISNQRGKSKDGAVKGKLGIKNNRKEVAPEENGSTNDRTKGVKQTIRSIKQKGKVDEVKPKTKVKRRMNGNEKQGLDKGNLNNEKKDGNLCTSGKRKKVQDAKGKNSTNRKGKNCQTAATNKRNSNNGEKQNCADREMENSSQCLDANGNLLEENISKESGGSSRDECSSLKVSTKKSKKLKKRKDSSCHYEEDKIFTAMRSKKRHLVTGKDNPERVREQKDVLRVLKEKFGREEELKQGVGRPRKKVCLVDIDHIGCDCPELQLDDINIDELDSLLKRYDGPEGFEFPCGACNAKYCRIAIFEVHMKKHSSTDGGATHPSLICPTCAMTFAKIRNYERHLRNKTCHIEKKGITKEINPTCFCCKFCCAYFTMKKSLVRHFKMRRCSMIGKGVDVLDIDRELLTVRDTTRHSFFNYEMKDRTIVQYAPSALLAETGSVAGEDTIEPRSGITVTIKVPNTEDVAKLMQETQKDMPFSNNNNNENNNNNVADAGDPNNEKNLAEKAIKKIASEKLKQITCSGCGKTFSNSQNMYRHVKSGVCKKVCSCGKVFPSMQDIYFHYRECPDRKPEPEPGLEKETEPVSCSVCEIPFPNANRLDYHVRHTHFPSLKREAAPFYLLACTEEATGSELPRRLFRCMECKEDFDVLKLLEEHFLTMHKYLVDDLLRPVDQTAKKIRREEIPNQVPIVKKSKQRGGFIVTESEDDDNYGESEEEENEVSSIPESTVSESDEENSSITRTGKLLMSRPPLLRHPVKRGRIIRVADDDDEDYIPDELNYRVAPGKAKKNPKQSCKDKLLKKQSILTYDEHMGMTEEAGKEDDGEETRENSASATNKARKKKRVIGQITWYNCQYCPKMMNARSDMLNHMMMHVGMRPYACVLCGSNYTRISFLSKHVMIHSACAAYQCRECDRNYRDKTSLCQHLRIHFADRNRVHSCTHCHEQFLSRLALRRHMTLHMVSSDSHRCHICHKRFTSRGELYKHSRSHLKETIHRCKKCNKSFRWANALYAHERTAHAGRSSEKKTKRKVKKAALICQLGSVVKKGRKK